MNGFVNGMATSFFFRRCQEVSGPRQEVSRCPRQEVHLKRCPGVYLKRSPPGKHKEKRKKRERKETERRPEKTQRDIGRESLSLSKTIKGIRQKEQKVLLKKHQQFVSDLSAICQRFVLARFRFLISLISMSDSFDSFRFSLGTYILLVPSEYTNINFVK